MLVAPLLKPDTRVGPLPRLLVVPQPQVPNVKSSADHEKYHFI